MTSIGDIFRTEKGLTRIDLTAIIGHALSLSKEGVLMEPERALSPEAHERIGGLVGERLGGKPLAYITGSREFYSQPFRVDEHVLIPRPETELLVERAIDILKRRRGPHTILDVGTGSGIIGILLARETGGKVFCGDLSRAALKVTRDNARLLGVEERIHLFCADLLGPLKRHRLFDLIVANLPYIPSAQWETLMADVRDFEPKTALLGGEEGMEIYGRFLPDAISFLKGDGRLLCEIGGTDQAETIARLLAPSGLRTRTVRDLSGQDRFVEAEWISSS